MKEKLTKKGKIVGALSAVSLLAMLFAPQAVGIIEVVKTTADETDCFGACVEERL